jgi:hypothetical protein
MDRVDRNHPESILFGFRTELADILAGCVSFEVRVVEHEAQVLLCHFADICHFFSPFRSALQMSGSSFSARGASIIPGFYYEPFCEMILT